MYNIKSLSLAAILALFLGLNTWGIGNSLLTQGVDFNADASLDIDGDGRWEDTTGATGFDLNLDTANGVALVTGTSALPGITAAYDMPGGFTGNAGASVLSIANAATQRSFAEAPGDWSNEDVTIEIWFKPDNLTPTPGNGQILFEDAGGTGFGFFVDNNELRLRKEPGTGNVGTNISGISGEFIQAVGTYDVSAGSMELFINGVSVGTDTPTGNDWSGGDAAGVGTRGDSNVGGIGNGQSDTESFDGQIAKFRVYRNQILTDAEVLNNFNAVATEAPSLTFAGGLIEYDASLDDGANNTWENTGTASGFDATSLSGQTYNASPSTALPGITAAYEFTGIGSGANVTTLNSLGNNGDDVAFELWFRPSDLTGDEVLFESGGGNGIGLFLGGGDNPIFAGVGDNELLFTVTQNSLGSQTAFVTADLTGLEDEFIHVLANFNNVTDMAELYINGIKVDMATASAAISDWSGGDNSGLGKIGGSNAGGVGGAAQGYTPFEGEIAIFRVLDRVVQEEEVQRRFDLISVSSAVPEPTTVALCLLGVGGMMTRRRRSA